MKRKLKTKSKSGGSKPSQLHVKPPSDKTEPAVQSDDLPKSTIDDPSKSLSSGMVLGKRKATHLPSMQP